MRRRGRLVRIVSLAPVAAIAVAACGGGGGTSSGGVNTNVTLTMGTTDSIVSADPAGSYDLGSWTVIWNVYQGLLKLNANDTTPRPDAATCNWQSGSSTVYVCTLKQGLKFSNGDPLTGDDVVYSFKRIAKICDPNGPSSLIGSVMPPPLDMNGCSDPTAGATPHVTASGNTVTFNLLAANSVWPEIIATGCCSIVDHAVFPVDKLLADDQIIGSGPYKVKKLNKQLADFVLNSNYAGDDQLHNSEFIIRYEQSGSTLVSDLQTGALDLGWRAFGPTDVKTLQSSSTLSVLQGQGAEIRYIVFNLDRQPGSGPAQKLAIRKAVAYVLDRAAVAHNAFNDTVQPLYSIIAAGLQGHTDAFKTVYGSSPSVSMAQQVLSAAGVTTPVPIDLWYTTDHYGPASPDEYKEIQRQLNASNLFNITLHSAPWASYHTDYRKVYGVFQLGWFPDYPDADDYTTPFYLGCNGNQPFMKDGYCNQMVDTLIAQEVAATDQNTRNQIFAQIQQLTAQDAPLIPVWQGGNIGVAHNNVTGVKDTLDPSYIFRFWLVGKS
jgi:peptide/nickel transport system substrate-binding protein